MGKRPLPSSLSSLSKEELIKLVLKHEPHLADSSIQASKKSANHFDVDAYPSQMIALKVSYFGGRYQGFASQVGLKNISSGEAAVNSANTVEDHLFRAMLRTKLILNPETCQYSRCGRTDAGVSATGQVIALRLRSSARKDSQEAVNYAKILNKQLPDDIKILDWAPVRESFSARFSCSARLYHYYFCKKHFDTALNSVFNLDVDLMNQAASKLIGVHDFRNYCRKDPSKPNQSFVREIFQASIEPVDLESGFYRFVCKGSAFLYHQVRCMMSVLFMIGSGREPLELCELLLSRFNKSVAGPTVHYELASEIPLVLFECFYEREGEERINWFSQASPKDIFIKHNEAHFHSLWELKQAESFIYRGVLSPILPVNFSGSSGTLMKKLQETNC